MRLTEPARAKVNLTLTVHGRRGDGFHTLESLVAFAVAAADTLEMDLSRAPGLTIEGPFAADLAGHDNLILDTLAAVVRAIPDVAVGHVTLHKALPVAAGIGGGSADAAATLRLVQRANPHLQVDDDAWARLSATLGSDVPVCFENRMSVMAGRGERVLPLAAAPSLAAVLVNPLQPAPANKTAAVFRALAAPALIEGPDPWLPRWSAATPLDEVLKHIRALENDLQAAASRVMPVITEVLGAIAATPEVRLVRLSGAGPTCFGLYADVAAADLAAHALRRAHPRWWIAATTLS